MALFIQYIGHRNTTGALTEDAFSQANPACTTTTGANGSSTLASQTNTTGVLGGSVAFCRSDVGNGFNGGPYIVSGAAQTTALGKACKPLGLFINDAVGNAFENTPGVASGKGPYTSGLGTMIVDLYETAGLAGTPGTMSNGVAVTTGEAIPWVEGLLVYASVNGYLTPCPGDAYEGVANGVTTNTTGVITVIGVVTQAPTSVSAQLQIDQRI